MIVFSKINFFLPRSFFFHDQLSTLRKIYGMFYSLEVGYPSSKSFQVQQEALPREHLLEGHAKYG